MLVRLKGTPVHNDSVALALGIDGRIPTGDEEDLLGLGAFGVKPFVVVSLSQGRVAPHLNVAYLWNGKSVLAGDVATGARRTCRTRSSTRWARTSASRSG